MEKLREELNGEEHDVATLGKLNPKALEVSIEREVTLERRWTSRALRFLDC